MSEEPEEKMSDSAKLMMAVVGAILVGFLLVGLSKNQTNEEKENSAMIRNTYNLVTMASDVCPKAIKKETGVQVYGNTGTKSDESSITVTYSGETGFKQATCKVESAKGGISELIIDGKTIVSR